MSFAHFVLSLVDAFGGRIEGRTLLQKRAFFVNELAESQADLGFDAHFYGPYSAIVDNTVGQLAALGLLEERPVGVGVTSSGFEVRRYDYSLTDDGKRVVQSLQKKEEYEAIAAASQRIRRAGDPNYVVLSIAAKAYFILAQQRKPLTKDELLKQAKKFDWNLPETSLQNAVRFLENLKLVKKT